MRATYRIFRGTMVSWDQLFEEAAEFASGVGKDRVISISHSEDANEGVVAVWYWHELPTPMGQRRSAAAMSDIEREIEENQQ